VNLPHLDITLGWVDIALLAIFGLSVLIGLWRGLVFELVSLLGWVVAFIIANTLGPALAELIPIASSQPELRLWIAYLVVFVLVLVACTLLARIVRGAMILVVVATLVTLSPYAHSTQWQDSHGALWLGMALEGLKPVLPQSLTVHINT